MLNEALEDSRMRTDEAGLPRTRVYARGSKGDKVGIGAGLLRTRGSKGDKVGMGGSLSWIEDYFKG